MIRLEHMNLVVKNIHVTLNFIQTAFLDWTIRGKGESEWYGKMGNWLHVGTNDYYITLNEGNEDSNRDLKGHSPGLAHTGTAKLRQPLSLSLCVTKPIGMAI